MTSLPCLRPLAMCVLLAGIATATATAAQPAAASELRIGVISLADDPRYEPRRLEQRYPGHPEGRPFDGMRVAAAESRLALEAAGLTLKLEAAEARDAQAAAQAAAALARQGVRYIVLDLPADAVRAAARTVKPADALLLNVSADDDALRGEGCAPNLLHTLPSRRMQADALMQALAARKWRKALLLTGPAPEDRAWQALYQQAARRFGVAWAAQRDFRLSNDPRERELANVRLLTGGPDHDVVIVADADGEFARTVPYATQLPRPVAGANGLTAMAWHRAWERHGGPQLNRRFVKAAGRPMSGHDWAGWVAVKAVVEAVTRAPKAPFAEQAKALRSGDIAIDGFKGPRLSFRPWDGQLRQPVLLAHPDGVAAVAPLDGFLHPKNNLDTLGADAPESACRR
ncbi:ABC transporter substrate-binding protein [Cupriavidus gilardii]|uniref:ABC transporter substrate-binding protein n=1 Tax=Cupriavidus gilardii TaxID=82541 RepID=UPI0028F6EC7E|nr:ABC transporter substrate-binding protein [Cupriavidus gilardii]